MKKKLTIRKGVPAGELRAYMERWRERAGDFVTIETIGKSGGYDILAAVWSDPAIADDEKEVALVVAQHSGMEISGMNAVLGVGNLLSGLSEVARKILSRQIVVMVPCPNVYSYAKHDPAYQFKNEFGKCEYAGSFGYEGVIDPDKTPAAKAIQNLIDRYRPEAFLDSHGVWYNQHIMEESSCNLSGAYLNRTHDQTFANEAIEAGEELGYPSFHADDAQRLAPADKICFDPRYIARYGFGRELCVAQTYSYFHYHTLSGSFEVAWEKSGTARIMRALEMGSEIRHGQDSPGYPVRAMRLGGVGLSALLVGGDNAAERRESRVEMWNNLDKIATAILAPEMPGLAGMFVSTSEARTARLLGGGFRTDAYAFCDALSAEGVSSARMRALLDDHWEGVYVEATTGTWGAAKGECALARGFTMRLRLPYPDADVRLVLLNGEPIGLDSHAGYTVLRDRSCTNVDVHIPAGANVDLATAFVKYDCPERDCEIVDI